MKNLSLLACSLLALSATAAPVPEPANEARDLISSDSKRAVDVTIDGQPVHLKGGYIRETDLNRMGWEVGDRDTVAKRQVDVDSIATRSSWGYIKPRDEKRQVDVDSIATRSSWGYIKPRDEKRQVDVDSIATRSSWGYIKPRDEEKRQVDVDGVATRSGWGYIKARHEE